MPDRSRTSDLALLVFGVGAMVMVSTAKNLWASGGRHWITPFALWFLLIVGAALAARRRKSRGP